jgi:hypothetical protein
LTRRGAAGSYGGALLLLLPQLLAAACLHLPRESPFLIDFLPISFFRSRSRTEQPPALRLYRRLIAREEDCCWCGCGWFISRLRFRSATARGPRLVGRVGPRPPCHTGRAVGPAGRRASELVVGPPSLRSSVLLSVYRTGRERLRPGISRSKKRSETIGAVFVFLVTCFAYTLLSPFQNIDRFEF